MSRETQQTSEVRRRLILYNTVQNVFLYIIEQHSKTGLSPSAIFSGRPEPSSLRFRGEWEKVEGSLESLDLEEEKEEETQEIVQYLPEEQSKLFNLALDLQNHLNNYLVARSQRKCERLQQLSKQRSLRKGDTVIFLPISGNRDPHNPYFKQGWHLRFGIIVSVQKSTDRLTDIFGIRETDEVDAVEQKMRINEEIDANEET